MASKKTKAAGSQKKKFGDILGIIGNVLMWAVLLVYFIGLPLYFQNGYEMIATNKYKFFMAVSKYAAFIVGAFVIAYFALWGMTREELKAFKPVWKIDAGMLGFLLIAFISCMVSPYRHYGEPDSFFFYESSLYGTSGWYMGFMTFLILICLYMVISRFFKYTDLLWIPILTVTTLIFIWGILNRYGIYPIEMLYSSESFVASIGNINWYAGFSSVMVPIYMGIYWGTEKVRVKNLMIVPTLIAYLGILLNGSDSCVLGIGVAFLVLFLISVKKEKKLLRFSELLIWFFAAAMIILILDLIFPGQRNYDSTLTDIFAGGGHSFYWMAFAVIIWLLCLLFEKGSLKYPEWCRKNLGKTVGFTVAGLAVLAILLIVINTLSGGALPVIGSSSLFTFGPSWGSKRGATWTSGVLNFLGMDFWHKLIGSGPDTFYFQLCSDETAYAYATAIFKTARLTNAHNEIITLLCNEGILGAGAFIAMVVFALKAFIGAAKEKPMFAIFVLSMVMYLANNIFSFQQITSTPFFFLMIAVGASALVKAGKEKA